MNEVVAMDLKQWRSGYILYLIDLFSRLTVGRLIKNKRPPTILSNVMEMWVGSGFGAPGKFLADNGGEFNNEEYRDMCQNLNVEIMHTAAESPWQNGICERNHAVVDLCLEKILEENPAISDKVALGWALNAKNSLQMWNGFSSYQLTFGKNPNLPSTMTDMLPALEGSTGSSTVAEHLNALHIARRAYVQAESSERIRRALRHKVRVNSERFDTGCKVFYKRDKCNKWKGPGRVIGQDGKMVFVRHGGVYVRVSPNRLVKCSRTEQSSENDADEPGGATFTKGSGDTEISAGDAEGLNSSEDESQSADKGSVAVVPVVPAEEADGQSPVDCATEGVSVGVQLEKCAAPSSGTDLKIPKKGDNIRYRMKGDSSWNEASVIGHAGKFPGSTLVG